VLFTFCQRSTGLLCSLLCGVLLHFPATAHSTVVEPLNISELAAESHRVVRATVVARYVLPHRGDRGEIYTRVELQVREYLLGDGPGQITVQQLGGQIGDLRMVISGNAEFEVGQEVIVFLDYAPEFELHYVVGLAQGLFRVHWVCQQCLRGQFNDGVHTNWIVHTRLCSMGKSVPGFCPDRV
jgi:hypothetical protein